MSHPKIRSLRVRPVRVPPHPLTLIDGQARFNGVIGSGVEWNESAVVRYAA